MLEILVTARLVLLILLVQFFPWYNSLSPSYYYVFISKHTSISVSYVTVVSRKNMKGQNQKSIILKWVFRAVDALHWTSSDVSRSGQHQQCPFKFKRANKFPSKECPIFCERICVTPFLIHASNRILRYLQWPPHLPKLARIYVWAWSDWWRLGKPQETA